LFNFTKAEMAAKATELNYIRDTLEKVFRLTRILSYINSQRESDYEELSRSQGRHCNQSDSIRSS